MLATSVPAFLRLFPNLHVGGRDRKVLFGTQKASRGPETTSLSNLKKNTLAARAAARRGADRSTSRNSTRSTTSPTTEALRTEYDGAEASDAERTDTGSDPDTLDEAMVSLMDDADEGNEHLAQAVGELEVGMDHLMYCWLTVRGSTKKVQTMRKDRKIGLASEPRPDRSASSDDTLDIGQEMWPVRGMMGGSSCDGRIATATPILGESYIPSAGRERRSASCEASSSP